MSSPRNMGDAANEADTNPYGLDFSLMDPQTDNERGHVSESDGDSQDVTGDARRGIPPPDQPDLFRATAARAPPDESSLESDETRQNGPVLTATQQQLAKMRAWARATQDELELKQLTEAKAAYDRGDTSAVYRLAALDKNATLSSTLLPPSSVLPKPGNPSIYKAKSRSDYNDWVRDCENCFNKAKSVFMDDDSRVNFGYEYLSSNLKTVWDTYVGERNRALAMTQEPPFKPYRATWDHFKRKMLDQLGTEYERQLRAHDAIKKASQRKNQTPTELLNYLKPLWDELGEKNVIRKVLDYTNALDDLIQEKLDNVPVEKRKDLSMLEEQANLVWRRLKQSTETSSISGDGHRRQSSSSGGSRKRHSENDKDKKDTRGNKRNRKNENRPSHDHNKQDGRDKPKKKIICYNCDQEGHKRPDCPKLVGQGKDGEQRGSSGKDKGQKD
jgi:Zinc knuckle